MLSIYSIIAEATSSYGIESITEFLRKGGIFMFPLILTSIAGAMAILYKLMSLTRARVIPDKLLVEIGKFNQLILTDRADPLVKQFHKGDSTLARLGAVVMKHRGKTHSEITQAVETAARTETVHLHAGIAVLDTVITVAPLLGLLGTASGLVTIFQGLGDNSDHFVIAQGIAEALTTTIFGLAIAVPCVIAHGHFVRKIETLTARLEGVLSELSATCEKHTTNA